MATNDEKISKFLQAINNYAEEQRQKILEEIQSYIGEELEKAEKEVLLDSYRLIQKETAEMRGNIRKALSRKEMADKKEVLSHRLDLMSQVFDKARERLCGYTKTPAYEQFLTDAAKRLSSVLTADDTLLLVRKEDLPMAEQLKNAFGGKCGVESSENIAIGGVLGSSVSMGLVADETLDTKLAAQQEWFEENSGLTIA